MPNPFDNLQQQMMWCTRGENCSICNSLSGRVYTYDMWMSAGVWPGFHLNCDCYLREVQGLELSDPDFFGGDLNLLRETINIVLLGSRLHLDPNWKPFSIYMTEQIMQAHLDYGKQFSIGQILKIMKQEFPGFFKRSPVYDNFFQWRVFRTVQHYENTDDTWSGNIPFLPKLGRALSGSPFYYRNTLKPDFLYPYFPTQTYTNSFYFGAR